MADPTADLTARLRGRHVKRMGELDQADWICGGHHGGYPPEWPCQTVVLLDALDAADAENARLRAALFDVTHAVMQEAEAHRYGQPAYDMTLDHLYEIADHHRSVLAVSEEATDV